MFYSRNDKHNVRTVCQRALPAGLLIKNSVYFLCKVCYTNTSVRRDGQTRADEKEKTQTFCGQIRPSTRRYRVKGDGAGRLEFLRFFDLAAALLLTYYCGRRILKTGRWPALFAALIYGGIVLTLGIILPLCVDL